MVVVFGYDMNKSNSEAVSRDRAENGSSIFADYDLDPKYDILLNAGKHEEMEYMSGIETGYARERGVDIGTALRRAASSNTWENAYETAKIAKEEGVSVIYLSTSRNHIKRAGDFLEKNIRNMVCNICVVRRPSKMNAYDGLTLREIRENSDFNYNELAQELVPVGDVRELLRESKNLSV